MTWPLEVMGPRPAATIGAPAATLEYQAQGCIDRQAVASEGCNGDHGFGGCEYGHRAPGLCRQRWRNVGCAVGIRMSLDFQWLERVEIDCLELPLSGLRRHPTPSPPSYLGCQPRQVQKGRRPAKRRASRAAMSASKPPAIAARSALIQPSARNVIAIPRT